MKILNIMTRSMAKTKQADVPSIYPLKGEHKKPWTCEAGKH